MLDMINSLDFGSGALVVAAISGLLALWWSRIRRRDLGLCLALGVPLAIAYSLYWSPVWLGDDPMEYSAW